MVHAVTSKQQSNTVSKQLKICQQRLMKLEVSAMDTSAAHFKLHQALLTDLQLSVDSSVLLLASKCWCWTRTCLGRDISMILAVRPLNWCAVLLQGFMLGLDHLFCPPGLVPCRLKPMTLGKH